MPSSEICNLPVGLSYCATAAACCMRPTSRNVSATSAHFPDDDCQATRAVKISPFKCSIRSTKPGSIPYRTINLPSWQGENDIEFYEKHYKKYGSIRVRSARLPMVEFVPY